MRKSIAITAASALLGVAGMGLAQTAYAQEDLPEKVWVCKYVGTPGEDEVVKGGQNPIHVATDTIEGEVKVGASFTDAQGRSVVVSLEEAEPDAGICEDFITPPTEPTEEPTDEPTGEPTDEPTGEPTDEPTGEPTDEPTDEPTGEPTTDPTTDPTDDPKDDDKGTDDPKDDDKGKDEPGDDDKDDSDRGVPAKTGGEGDLGALALIGTIGLAASGGVLVASRRKH